MAITHFSTGPVTVTFNSVQLGYSEDGARVRLESKRFDIHSDDWGGQGGAPSDIQLLGATATCQVNLTKYDKTFVEVLTSFTAGGTKATLPTFGTFMKQDSKTGILLLDGVNEERSFPVAFVTGAMEYNAGTRARFYQVSFEMHLNASSTRVMFTDAVSPT